MGSDDGHTIAVEHCAECPELEAWTDRDLVRGQCPRCGQLNDLAWRVLAARRLIGRLPESRWSRENPWPKVTGREDGD